MFDPQDAMDVWRTCVEMQAPTIGDLRRKFSVVPIPVFEHAPSIRYLRNNLAILLPPGEAIGDKTRINAIFLIGKEGYFRGATSVTTNPIPKFHFLGTELPTGANQLLDYLKNQDAKHVQTATSINRWEIFYGGAIAIMFNSSNPRESNIEKSSLASVKFIFTTPYSGTLDSHIHFLV